MNFIKTAVCSPLATAVNSLVMPFLSRTWVPTGMRLAYRPTMVFVYFWVTWSSGNSGPITTSCVCNTRLGVRSQRIKCKNDSHTPICLHNDFVKCEAIWENLDGCLSQSGLEQRHIWVPPKPARALVRAGSTAQAWILTSYVMGVRSGWVILSIEGSVIIEEIY